MMRKIVAMAAAGGFCWLLWGCGINPAARELARQEKVNTARLDSTSLPRGEMRRYLQAQAHKWQQLVTYAHQVRFSAVQLTEQQKQKVEGFARQLRIFARRMQEHATTEAEEREMIRRVREHWHSAAAWLGGGSSPEGPGSSP